MRTFFHLPLILLGAVTDGEATGQPLPRDAAVYIEKMPEDLHVYLKAEIVKKKIPLRVVSRVADAEFIVRGSAGPVERRLTWWELWLKGHKDLFSGAIEILRVSDGQLIWAGEAGDRSLVFGHWRRGGIRKVAGRLAKKLRKAVRIR